MAKNIKIQIWTDGFFCKTIGIWRPEEEPSYIAPDTDTRSSQEINIPFYLVLSSVFSPRSEVLGNNPIAPSQHPMPRDFLKYQIRHISYMFANDIAIFQPPTKAIAQAWITKQTIGYKLDKEYQVQVSDDTGNMTLKDFKNSLAAFSDTQLEKIKVKTVAENPLDAAAKNLNDYIHIADDDIPQYISITKLLPVFDIQDPYIPRNILDPDTINNSTIPNTQDHPLTQDIIGDQNQFASINSIEFESLKMFDKIMDAPVRPVDYIPTKEDILIAQLTQLKK